MRDVFVCLLPFFWGRRRDGGSFGLLVGGWLLAGLECGVVFSVGGHAHITHGPSPQSPSPSYCSDLCDAGPAGSFPLALSLSLSLCPFPSYHPHHSVRLPFRRLFPACVVVVVVVVPAPATFLPLHCTGRDRSVPTTTNEEKGLENPLTPSPAPMTTFPCPRPFSFLMVHTLLLAAAICCYLLMLLLLLTSFPSTPTR